MNQQPPSRIVRTLSTLVELVGLVIAVAGLWRVAGAGVAMLIGGVVLVLVGFAADPRNQAERTQRPRRGGPS